MEHKPNLIYESPDGGKTVYARQSGSTDRWVHSIDGETQQMLDRIADDRVWSDIRDAARTNVALADLLEQVKMTYQLTKNENSSKD
jgi:hypothetical protein